MERFVEFFAFEFVETLRSGLGMWLIIESCSGPSSGPTIGSGTRPSVLSKISRCARTSPPRADLISDLASIFAIVLPSMLSSSCSSISAVITRFRGLPFGFPLSPGCHGVRFCGFRLMRALRPAIAAVRRRWRCAQGRRRGISGRARCRSRRGRSCALPSA